MATTVSDFLIERLIAWGVRRIFGYPGDGINGIIAALHRHDDVLDFVQVRHEEQAAFMACAHAKFTGELGVCLATSGPGAIHLLNGLYDAKIDHSRSSRSSARRRRRRSAASTSKKSICRACSKTSRASTSSTVMTPAQVRHAIDRAVRIALRRAHRHRVIFPKDVQEEKRSREPPHKHEHQCTPALASPAPRVDPARSAI